MSNDFPCTRRTCRVGLFMARVPVSAAFIARRLSHRLDHTLSYTLGHTVPYYAAGFQLVAGSADEPFFFAADRIDNKTQTVRLIEK